MTVHKSQGLTLNKVTVDLGKKEGRQIGRIFVALSRVRNLEDIRLQNEEGQNEQCLTQIDTSKFLQMRLNYKGTTKKTWSERLEEWTRLENLDHDTRRKTSMLEGAKPATDF